MLYDSLPAGADHRPGGRSLRVAAVRLRGSDGRCSRSSSLLDRALGGPADAARRSASAAAPGAAWSGPSWRSCVAYSKRLLARALERSDFVEEPWLERDLREYFPAAVVKRFGHLLRRPSAAQRQLICMVNSNAVVNSLGPTFVSQLMAERGAEAADVVRAFRIAREVTGADARWEVVERLEGVDQGAAARADGRRRRARRGDHALVPDVGAGGRDRRRRSRPAATASSGSPRCSASSAPTSASAAASRPPSGSSAPASRSRSRAPTRCAPSCATRPTWCGSPGATGRPIEEVAEVFFAVGAELRLDWIEAELERVPAPDPDAALGAPGRARGRRPGAPRAGRRRAAAETPDGDVEAFLAERSDALRRFEVVPALARRARASPTSPGSRLRSASCAHSPVDAVV